MSNTLTLPREAELPMSDVSPLTMGEQLPAVREVAVEAATTLVGSKTREDAFQHCLSQLWSYLELSTDWDKYGGVAAQHKCIQFAEDLLNLVRMNPDVPAPLVRPISTGAFIEWRHGESTLYFEIDEESVLRYSRSTFGEETDEDPEFDLGRAQEAVVDFHKAAA